MSTIHLRQALDTRADITPLEPLERLVLVYLSETAGPGGAGSMAVGRLAQKANAGSETVSSALRLLTHLDLSQPHDRNDRNAAMRAPVYRLTIDHAAVEGAEESSA
ncbi:hypothetical protein OG705_30005 [Streptomyces sp. NBC_00838]|uniref:hypothetical protein n=1 Tax=Streptomyces sp. NBC_00838 TaxID=2903680 RepID=UPI003866217C|nr:hypothetical protein OG705_30005 [Streptomyces sp. NBC_00838]